MGPAADEGVAVTGLELLEAASVDGAGYDLADVYRGRQVSAHYAEQVLGVMDGCITDPSRAIAELAVIEMGDNFATDPQAIELVLSAR